MCLDAKEAWWWKQFCTADQYERKIEGGKKNNLKEEKCQKEGNEADENADNVKGVWIYKHLSNQ